MDFILQVGVDPRGDQKSLPQHDYVFPRWRRLCGHVARSGLRELVRLTSEFAKSCHAQAESSRYTSEKYQFSEFEDCMTLVTLRDFWAELPAFKSQFSGLSPSS